MAFGSWNEGKYFKIQLLLTVWISPKQFSPKPDIFCSSCRTHNRGLGDLTDHLSPRGLHCRPPRISTVLKLYFKPAQN